MDCFTPSLDRSRGSSARRGLALATLCLMASGGAHAAQDDRIKIGAGVAVTPKFQGSSSHRLRAVPLIDIKKGRIFARTDDGIGLNIIETSAITMGAGLNLMRGYRSSDVPDGIGKLSDAVGARVFMSTNVAGARLRLSATQALNKNSRGMIAVARASYPYAVTSQLMLVPSVAVSWANEKYLSSYFGVDGGQSVRSGKSQYHPSAGFKDVSMRVAVNYSLNKSWSITGAVGASTLLDKAADSPIVEKKTQLHAVAGVAYTF